MKLSIGIPAYDEWSKLQSLLLSLQRQETDLDFEVIVGDDCHPDDLAEKVRQGFPRVVAFRNAENSGPAFTRNRILEMAQGEYVAFFDADCVVPPGWIESVRPHLEPMRLLSGRVVRPDGSVEWVARRTTWMGVSLPCAEPDANVASSNNMVVPRALALDIGGFNEALRIYFEDSLFSIQCRQAGATVAYLAEATVEHHHHSLRNPGRLALQSRNTLWSMVHVYRGRPPWQLACTLALLLNYTARVGLHLVKLEPAFSLAYLRGMRDGLGWILRKPWRQHWIERPLEPAAGVSG